MGVLRPLGVLLAMLIAPPFAFLAGAIAAVVIWILLDGTSLPTWGRLSLSLMAVPAVPGLWFVVMPFLFARQNVTSFDLAPEVMAWHEKQFELEQRHRAAFEALRRQPVERVVPGGLMTSADDVVVTLVAVELGTNGGTITLVHRRLDLPGDPVADPKDLPAPLGAYAAITHMTDDAGTEYFVSAMIDDLSLFGGRSHVDFVPAPPAGATQLRLSLSHLAQLDATLSRRGPWEFVLQLR